MANGEGLARLGRTGTRGRAPRRRAWRTGHGHGRGGFTTAPLWSGLAQAVAVRSWTSSRHAGVMRGGLWLAVHEGGEMGARRCSPFMQRLELGDTTLGAVVLGSRGRVEGDQGVDRAARALLRQCDHCCCSGCSPPVRPNVSPKFKFEISNKTWWVAWYWSPGSRYIGLSQRGTGLILNLN